jgi:hypothetical protein
LAQLLTTPFIQLPIHFDPLPLLNEVVDLSTDYWVRHRLPNLHSIPLVQHTEKTATWCPVINHLPLLQGLLHTWRAPLGESRVSILEPGASVKTHVDVDYYWKHRLRVHIILQTNSKALFGCDNHILSLPAGQLWVSNNWAPHWIANNGSTNRIHIVIDTVGSPILWEWISQGWHSTSNTPMPTELLPLVLKDFSPTLMLEKEHRDILRTPAELQEIIDDCIHDMKDTTHLETITQCRSQLRKLQIGWRTLYQQYGDDSSVYHLYSTTLSTILSTLPNPLFWNGVDLHTTLKTQVGVSLSFA